MELKEGDKVYRLHRDTIQTIYTIERITKTQAICVHNKFKKEYSDSGTITPIPNDNMWGAMTYKIETKELKAKLYRYNLISKVLNIGFKDLSNEHLEDIIDLAGQSDRVNS